MPTGIRLHIEPGTKYGNLTVVNEVEAIRCKSGGSNRRFLCVCVCGKEHIAYIGNLRMGRTTSCGCCSARGSLRGRTKMLEIRRARSQESDAGRICLTCGEWQTWDHFKPDPRRERGKASNCDSCARWRRIRRVYGITKSQWHELYTAQSQSCALCREYVPELHMTVDHDHSHCGSERGCSDCVRGLLCQGCNRRVVSHLEAKPALRRLISDYLAQRPLKS